VIRVDQTRLDNNIFKARQKIEENMGRPRVRWIKDAGNGLQAVNVKRWRQKVNNRED
jgi:hypothetical protein